MWKLFHVELHRRALRISYLRFTSWWLNRQDVNDYFHKPSVVIQFAEYLTIDPSNRGATYMGTSEESRRSRHTDAEGAAEEEELLWELWSPELFQSIH